MPNGVQILSSQTTSTRSAPFRISQADSYKKPGDKPLLGIYGTYGTAACVLEYKAPDGSWYPVNGLSILGNGLYELPVNSEVELSLNYTAGGGSNINAFVYNGV